MNNTTPCQPIGNDDGQYLGACGRPTSLFTGLSSPRNPEGARRVRLDDQNPRTCITCGYVGKQAEFYSSRKLRDTCKECRQNARRAKIGEGHARRLRAMPATLSKRCTGCGDEKTANQFRRSIAKVKGETLVPQCKPCEALSRVKERNAKTPEQLQALRVRYVEKSRLKRVPIIARNKELRAERNAAIAARTERPCSTCCEVKKLEFFTKNAKMLDGHAGMCKACQAAEASRRRALDPEGYLAKMRVRNARDPSRQKMVQETRKATLQHPQWAGRSEIRAVFAEAEFMTKATGVPHAVDHIWPLKNQKVCGLHVAANLRVVPRRLNSKKLNKLPGFLRDQLWDPDASDVFYEQEAEEPQHA